MNDKEIKEFMQRIKSYYQEFAIDDYKIKEWASVLKNYDNNDVHKSLEKHLGSEQWGRNIPQLSFLVKYLTKKSDKEKQKDYYMYCPLCNELMINTKFDAHYERCSSVNYLNNQSIKFFNKPIDREKYMSMDQVEFNEKYDKMIKLVFSKTNDEMQKNAIRNMYSEEQIKIDFSKLI